MVKQKTRWRTSDGQEFTTESEADTHEQLVEAKADYEKARDRFGRLLAEREQTADGQPFRFDHIRHYAVIWAFTSPQLIEVALWPLHWDWHLDERDRLVLAVEVPDLNRADGHRRRIDLPVSILYCSLDAARKALIDARRQKVEEAVAALAEIEADPNNIRPMY